MTEEFKKCSDDIQDNDYSIDKAIDEDNEDINRIEDNRVIVECTKESNIILEDKLGSGTYGYVYSAKYRDKNVAVKKIITEIVEPYEESYYINEIFNEVKYSKYMENSKIGPDIYRYFYIIYTKNNKKYIITYIIMDKYDYSLHSFLISRSSEELKIKTIRKCMYLIYKQVYETSLFCIDIKPGNFVVRISSGNLDVKMIDFGGEFCKQSISEQRNKGCKLSTKKSVFYVYNLLQFYMILLQFGFSYIILEDKKFIAYFIENKDENSETIIGMFKAGMLQTNDQCHLNFHYSDIMYDKYLSEVEHKRNKSIYKDMDPELPKKLYEILYYYIEKDIEKINV